MAQGTQQIDAKGRSAFLDLADEEWLGRRSRLTVRAAEVHNPIWRTRVKRKGRYP